MSGRRDRVILRTDETSTIRGLAQRAPMSPVAAVGSSLRAPIPREDDDQPEHTRHHSALTTRLRQANDGVTMTLGTARFTLAIDDLVDAQRFVQRPVFLLGTAIGIGALVLGFVVVAAGGSPQLAVAAIAYGLLDLVVVRFRPVQRWLAAGRARGIVGKEFEFTLDPDRGLVWTEPGGGGSFSWSSLSELREDDRLLAFMAGGVARASVPKRAFSSPGDLTHFRGEARRLIEAARADR